MFPASITWSWVSFDPELMAACVPKWPIIWKMIWPIKWCPSTGKPLKKEVRVGSRHTNSRWCTQPISPCDRPQMGTISTFEHISGRGCEAFPTIYLFIFGCSFSMNTSCRVDFIDMCRFSRCNLKPQPKIRYKYIPSYGYGSKNPLDRPAVIRTSGTRGLRKGVWSRGLQDPKWYDMKCLRESVPERSGIETARPAIMFTLGFNLTLSSLGTGRHEFQISWIVNQQLEERKETKQSQVLTRRYTELVVVWIGSGSVWIWVWIGLRLQLDPLFCACCTLGAVWQEKDDKVSSLTAWKLGSVALQQFVACMAGWITADINSPIYSIIPKVWIKGLDQLPWKGLDRGSGSEVWIVCGTGAWSRPYILSRSHITQKFNIGPTGKTIFLAPLFRGGYNVYVC